MPQFLVTTYKGLDAERREVVTAPNLAKARARVLARYPDARARSTSTPRPTHDLFTLKYDDPEKQYAHLTLNFSIHREDTAPFEVYAYRAEPFN